LGLKNGIKQIVQKGPKRACIKEKEKKKYGKSEESHSIGIIEKVYPIKEH
jgi:hypothetical protein